MVRKSATRNPGFSLVELVIVVVIIGVIAAIAVPRISRGAKGAAESALQANLKAMRAAIDMYASEHDGKLPGGGGSATGFWSRLTKRTNANGNVGTTAGEHIYGPYLRGRIRVPVGPNAGASGVVMTTSAPPSAVDEGQVMRGWVYNYHNGKLIANTDDLDSTGVGYDTY